MMTEVRLTEIERRCETAVLVAEVQRLWVVVDDLKARNYDTLQQT